jgi:RNA polymerase sigma-70 factor, ECF subfamily
VAEVHRVADQATIDRAREGDRGALGVLWRIYHPQLLRLLRAKRSPSPDDVASQVWIDVGRALARFAGDGVDFRRWLFTIASRRSTDEVRRIRRRHETAVDALKHLPSIHDDDRVTDLDSLDDVLSLIATLPSNMAEAVMLRLMSDMSFEEVASVMRTTEGNARVLVHRGLTKLRAEISRQSGGSMTSVSSIRPDNGSRVRIAAVEAIGEKS